MVMDQGGTKVGEQDALFIIEDEPAPRAVRDEKAWTIAVIDDDAAVHDGTRFALYDYSLNGQGLRILSAFSAAEGRRLMAAEPNIAVVLLDVVMETDRAGLDLVDFIRKELKNETVRIVLRTGQPGQAPERHVVVDYDINDYKAKTELTADKLYTTLTAALRSYQQLERLTDTRRGLEVIIEAAAALVDLRSMGRLSDGVLAWLTSLLGIDCCGMLLSRDPAIEIDQSPVLAACGRHRRLAGRTLAELDGSHRSGLIRAFTERRSRFDGSEMVLHVPTASGREIVILFDTGKPLSETERELVQLFASRLSVTFDNVVLYEQLQEANAHLEERVMQRTSELHRANQRLSSQRASLQKVNHFKSEMLGTVAHDLKNPLGVILGRAEILTDLLEVQPTPVEPMRTQLIHIRDSAKRLTGMVDDLMVHAVNDVLDISIRRDPLDCAALAAEVVEANRLNAERKGQTIGLGGARHLRLSGDPERLREAIDNLVSNAIKYSPIGADITVCVDVDRTEAVVRVKDHGPGLSPEDLARVFGRFQRLSAKPTGGEGSTGLGLSIVKRIAELHGGRVTAESAGAGLGSTFSIHLPLRPVEVA
ncbi:MAG TPA: DUF3369 domain-containing protein [Microvirga sp.]|jgi:signal transduction histidine kinase